VDTSGFYALLVARDRMHARACGILRQAARLKLGFVTTDYVLDEAATLFRARGHGHLAAPLFETVQASAACSIEWMDPDRFEETRRFFMKHGDQDWSFTDSFSFLVMREKKIRDALTSDRHFREAGCNALLL
jgi:predicted nucleic acid-binding protein